MELDTDEVTPTQSRPRRAQGQLGGVVGVPAHGRDRQDVGTELSDAPRAPDRAGIGIVATGLRQAVTGHDRAGAPGLATQARPVAGRRCR